MLTSNTGIYITIRSPKDMADILKEAIGKKLIKGLTDEEFKRLFDPQRYPIHVPVELNSLVALMDKPIVKTLGNKKIEKAAQDCLKMMMEAG